MFFWVEANVNTVGSAPKAIGVGEQPSQRSAIVGGRTYAQKITENRAAAAEPSAGSDAAIPD
jgi:hypothetical protein